MLQYATIASSILTFPTRSIDDTTKDWSRWDATHSFIQGKNPDFITNELNANVLSLYKFNFSAILDNQFNFIHKSFFDFDKNEFINNSETLMGALNTIKEKISKKYKSLDESPITISNSTNFSGFFSYHGAWYYFSTSPVFPSNLEGKSNGFIIFGRIIDDKEILRIKDGININPINRLAADKADTLFSKALFQSAPYSIDRISQDRIRIYHTLETAFGPKLVFYIDENRHFYAESIEALKNLNIIIALSFIIFLAFLFFLLEKLILNPLRNLAVWVGTIDNYKTLTPPPHSWGHELSSFTKTLRKTLEKLAHSQSIITKQNENMRHILSHDSLTGLPNTSECERIFEETISSPKNRNNQIHMFYIRLTNLKLINSTLGFPRGNIILAILAQRLSTTFSDALSIACVDGHRFALLYDGKILTQQSIEEKCRTILRTIEEPELIEDLQVHISASLGVASYPQHGNNIIELHSNASTAADHESQTHYTIYNESLSTKIKRHFEIGQELHNALEKNEFKPFFQPKLDLKTEKIIGSEALIRWCTPDGILSPATFIPIAEETGIIVQLTWLMLEAACIENQRLAALGFDISVSVNVPVQVILHTDFITYVLDILERTGMPAHNLDIEITEETLIADTKKTCDVINALHRHGIEVSVDDFGTGYSSLQYLKEIPFNTIKIDKSFVEGLPHNKYNEAIIRSCVHIAGALEMKVIVEGIEHKEEWQAIKEMGCDQLQGYVISRPVPIDDFIHVLRKWNTPLSPST